MTLRAAASPLNLVAKRAERGGEHGREVGERERRRLLPEVDEPAKQRDLTRRRDVIIRNVIKWNGTEIRVDERAKHRDRMRQHAMRCDVS